MKDPQLKSKANLGFTLIEILISITLGSIVMISVLQSLLMAKHFFMLQQGLARIQENAQTISMVLGKTIRTSGSLGCHRFTSTIPMKIHFPVQPEHYSLKRGQFVNPVTLSTSANPLVMTRIKPRALLESHILWLNSVTESYPLLKPTLGHEGVLIVKGQPVFQGGEVLVLSDCAQSDIVQARGPSQSFNHGSMSKITISQKDISLSHYYQENAQVSRLTSVLFYVGNTGRKNAYGQPVYALYKTDLNGQTWELVEGVEKLQLQYRIQKGNEVVYVAPEQMTDWQNVMGVKLRFLLNSVEPCLGKPHSVDELLRQWWIYEWSFFGGK